MIQISDFKREVLDWAEEIGVKPKEIHIRKMKHKWGSCSSKGRLTFSFEVLDLPKNERSKIIVHELLHLKYKTHNKFFYLMMSAYLNKRYKNSGDI